MDHNLDVVFLGGLFPNEIKEEILRNSKGDIQNAANNLQWEFIKGLDANLGGNVKIINSLYIGSYPKRYKKMKINTFQFSHNESFPQDINVGFINVFGIKHFSRYYSLKSFLKEWATSESSNQKIIIAYAMTSTFTHLLKYLKKLNKKIVTCLIVPDLPQYMNLSNNYKFYNLLKNLEINLIKQHLKYVDSYVLLTEYMRAALNIKAPSIVIEGISTDLFENIPNFSKDNQVKTILYSGGLVEKYGIRDLINAFERLDDNNCRLVICGSGEAESFIREAQNKDKRIIFKGLINREEVLEIQKNSYILINPRKNNEEYTKYSFPSKLLEYLSSGTPVISYKLDGIPKEYYPHFYEVKETEDGLFETLKEVLLKDEDELRQKGQQARAFVLNNKNGKKQIEKLVFMTTNLLIKENSCDHSGEIES